MNQIKIKKIILLLIVILISISFIFWTITRVTGTVIPIKEGIMVEEGSVSLISDRQQRLRAQSTGIHIFQDLTVANNIFSQAFFYSSDKNLKEEINLIDNSLEKILKLNGVYFNWKEDGKRDIGLIAQNVKKVFPEIVQTQNGYKSVDYSKLVAPLIEAIKEQEKRIQILEIEIEKFKK